MSKLLELLSTLSVAGSTVVICILLLRLIPLNISTKWRYVLGKLAVWFYILPVALLFQWFPLPFTTKPIITNSVSGLPSTISAELAVILISLWGIGAASYFTWQIYCYRRFIKSLQRTRIPVLENSEAAIKLLSMKQALDIQNNVEMAYSSAIRSPILVGLWKSTIFLPIDNTINVDLNMIMHHELIHLKRRDLWVKALSLGASSLHWFNPLVHVLRKDIHIWSELSCDEEVVKEMSYAERKRYGQTILNVMAGSKGLPVRFCTSLSGDGKQLKRRLNMMLNVKKLKKKTILSTSFAVIIVGTIGLSSAVWASINAPDVEIDTKLAKIRNGVTIKSEGVKEGNLNDHRHEIKHLKP
ncbi:M56 family metallopeptidase [Paenibacillus thiaminolyticus]|uniref:M56 family metallopeptidase n=1 Tax=Paenibacillus thiaminolyticus TaxID=49283 RepID=A0AAP9DRA7_PANTH|nr:M56 family metallopeptidase [Paenibacillus thiaminolyticus]MCY9539044.1 M56 family metallopeptidase [Paenibacillus thiaminolyticus]MCY9605025.1 M56 family metallopeptidase [Paenibacillus thiaminolyticus]MCY9611212.1 M56 family metallopeptidase [Paenibacillus thiaminolyticus]MCY9616846.1 M56 family metallopeptidase [Paenibacillus thiaminolyticus]MCY9622491.1 M56 family metallopeptidase [Paenibacillus thiaminolyticus]